MPGASLEDQLAERLGLSPDSGDPAGAPACMRVQLGGCTVQPWTSSSDGLCGLQLPSVDGSGCAAACPLTSALPSCAAVPYCCCNAGFSQQMAKMYNNLGLKMMERRKHDEAMGLVSVGLDVEKDVRGGAGAAGWGYICIGWVCSAHC